MNLVSALINQHFGSSNGELVVGGVPVKAITAQYGTPLFIYDCSVIERKLLLLRQTLPSKFAISYSVKANPNPVILRHFVDNGCGLEVASAGEFFLSLAAGSSPSNIVFAGPGKTEAELEFVLVNQIGEIHAESEMEMKRISAICGRLRLEARVALRVNPSAEVQGGAMRMGGRPAPFGIDEERLDEVLDRILNEPCIRFRGIHLFTGTQILEHEILVRQYRRGLEIARRVTKRLQRPVHTVDFGGGLGIPYFSGDRELDLERLRGDLSVLITEIESDSCFDGTQFMVEPGRYLIGEAGIYVTRINDIKVSRGKKFLIVDGGMNHHLAASGNLGQVIKRNFPLAVISKLDQSEKETVDIVGPLCTPLDTLARDVKLPSTDVGDLVGVFQSGAYARTSSPLGFLSHPSPPEVWVNRGNIDLIRPRGSHKDLL
jgi:diaminopimelate decarboxylase